jgi:hypothetical protein
MRTSGGLKELPRVRELFTILRRRSACELLCATRLDTKEEMLLGISQPTISVRKSTQNSEPLLPLQLHGMLCGAMFNEEALFIVPEALSTVKEPLFTGNRLWKATRNGTRNNFVKDLSLLRHGRWLLCGNQSQIRVPMDAFERWIH